MKRFLVAALAALLLAACVSVGHQAKYLDFSAYGFGLVPSDSVMVRSFALESGREPMPNDLNFEIPYDKLPPDDQTVVDRDRKHQSGEIIEIRFDGLSEGPSGKPVPGKSVPIYFRSKSGSWQKLRDCNWIGIREVY